jgi:hypothetical protein
MNAGADKAHATIYDDFATPGSWPGDKWYRHLPIPGLWDPATVVTCGGGPDGTLAVETRRFTLGRKDGHDNVKALIYSTAEFAPGERGIISVSTDMRVTTFGTGNNPYGVDAGDVRLGCGALNTIDLKTWMVFDFFVSGSRIVPLYERLPFGISDADPYPAFSELVPIDVPTKQGEWHHCAIRYDRARDRVSWMVDGATVAERDAVGAPPGERGPVVKSTASRSAADCSRCSAISRTTASAPAIAPAFPASIRTMSGRCSVRAPGWNSSRLRSRAGKDNS